MRSNLRADLLLTGAALALGALAAAAYGAWRAVSREGADTAARWDAFGEALVFPGSLIALAIAAVVWLGWKANID